MSRSSFPTAVLLSFVAGLSGAGLAACGSGGPKPTATPSGPFRRSLLPSGSPSGAPSAGVNASRDAYSPDKRAFVCGCLGPRLGVSGAECTDEVASDPGSYVPECYRAHKSDCQGYIECVYMEPSGTAECLADEIHVPSTCATCRCAVPCGAGKPACAKGKECLDTADGNKACL